MNTLGSISRVFVVTAIVMVGNVCVGSERGKLNLSEPFRVKAHRAYHTTPLGRAGFGHLVNKALHQNEVKGCKAVLIKTSTTTMIRAGGQLIDAKAKTDSINYGTIAKSALTYGAADGGVRFVAGKLADYGVSGKALAKKIKENMPESLSDLVEEGVLAAEELAHILLSETIVGAVDKVKTGGSSIKKETSDI